jgi:hypothetical protein
MSNQELSLLLSGARNFTPINCGTEGSVFLSDTFCFQNPGVKSCEGGMCTMNIPQLYEK